MIILLFFGKNLNFKTIEGNRFHKIALTELRMGKLLKFPNVLGKYDGTRKIKRLTKLVENRHPAL